jgi:hypothetical protein
VKLTRHLRLMPRLGISGAALFPHTPSHHAQRYHYCLTNCFSALLTVSNVGAMTPEVGVTLGTGASGVLFAV